ncbi:MAG TPA: hypothetical protein VN769_12535 [Xanthobacteraceae bacterium]|nr:hypothetical protein [Xanthobacteraceae bacterium]
MREKVDALLAERARIRATLSANTSALRDAVAAGRFFGVEIELPPDVIASSGPAAPSTPTPGHRERVRLQESTLFEATTEVSIREAVIEELRNAGSKGARASEIRQKVESRLGRQLHYKTIGMTLYRLSEKGKARRDGLTWYHAPRGA